MVFDDIDKKISPGLSKEASQLSRRIFIETLLVRAVPSLNGSRYMSVKIHYC